METLSQKVVDGVQAISSMVNTYSTDKLKDQFIQLMSTDHRTLQNSFTRLALQWIEFVASDKYRTDGRNESSHKVCKELLEAFRKHQEAKGYTGLSLDIMSDPSMYCNMV